MDKQTSGSTLKRHFDKFMAIVPHITYMMSLVYIVLLIFDKVNVAMVFINNNITKNSLFVYTALVILQSIYSMVKSREKTKKDQNK